MIFKMPVGDLKAEMLIDAAPMMMMTMMLMTIELLQLLLFNFVGTTFVAFLDASYLMSRCRLILCRLFDSRKRFGCGGRGKVRRNVVTNGDADVEKIVFALCRCQRHGVLLYLGTSVYL